MSNAENSETAGAAGNSVASSGASAGTLLRQAREAAGLHIAALAVAMKVPVKKLEALESDRFDLLPDAVFARALAGSMCRTLKIDPNPILEKLPGTKKVSLTVEARAANEPFNKSTYSASNASSMKLGKTAVLIVLALLVGVALILFVPASEDAKPVGETAVEEVEPHFPLESSKQPVEEIVIPMQGSAQPGVAPLSQASAPVTPASAPATTPTVTTVPVPVVPAVPSTPTVPATPATKVSAPQQSTTTPNTTPSLPAPKQEAVSAPSAVSANHVVVFKVRGPSWIKVIDAKGGVQLERNLKEGEEVGAAGALPMMVVVGSANVTDVSVRGKPFDLSKITEGNVARFEVK